MTHPYWQQIAVARHEAAHCIAAQEMGLKVAWVSIQNVTAEGEIYKAACGLDMEDGEDMNVLAVNADIPADKLLGVCVSMAMPSFTTNPSEQFYGYSVEEYRQAIGIAERGGISEEEIELRCEVIADERRSEILDLADRLVTEGRIEFSSV